MTKTKINDKLARMKGTVTIVRKDADGNVLKTETIRNLIVNGGRNALAALLGGTGTGTKEVTEITFGTNGATPLPADVAPLTNNFDKTLDGETYDGVNLSVTFAWSLDNAENNGVTIREFGLLCADGTLFSRVVHPGIAKDVDTRLEGTWKIEF